MKKRKTLSQVKKEVWEVFSRYVRTRDCLHSTGTKDYGKCTTCGRLCRIGEADAGHFISRRYSSTLFDETNCHIQCKQCNAWGGQILEYRRQIVKRYGEGYDIELEDKAMEIKKYTIPELEELKSYYTQKVKEMEG